jgi:uncharacterized membrane protein
MPRANDLAGAALLGAAAGMRTFTAPAALTLRGRLLPGSRARFAVLAAAGGEFIGDKSPGVPARTSPPAFAGRIASGIVCGRVVAGTAGAVAGGAGAVAGTLAGHRARAALGELSGLPDPVLGVVEDGVAIGAAALASGAAVRPYGREPEQEAPPRRVLRGLARGAVAGVAGTAVMTAAQVVEMRLTGRDPSRAPEQVGRRVVRGLFGKRVPRKEGEHLNQAMHWLYGTSWGMGYGVVTATGGTRPDPLKGGAALGATAWAASLAQLPAFGVAPPPWEQPPAALAADLVVHLAYGVAVAGVLRALP